MEIAARNTICLLLVVLSLASCRSTKDLPPSIAKYYPTEAQSMQLGHAGIMGLNRDMYAKRLYGRSPGDAFRNEYDRDFHLGYYGDREALHRFWKSAYRDMDGEFGEVWVSDCFVLLLRWKDADLKRELASASDATRGYVGFILKTYADEFDKKRYAATLQFCAAEGATRDSQLAQPASR